MRAKLKELYSLELDQPMETYWPEDEANFGFSVRLMIGLEDCSQAESFDILVCTPDWLKDQYREEKCTWGHHMLIVFEYDFDLIRRKIESYVAGIHGDDWLNIAKKLGCISAWEFEGYQPYQAPS